jgi:tripartite-type tricarboxylate transporter receptor subunit TctC
MHKLLRIALALIAASLLVPAAALAQAFPSKPVRIVVPYPPGGGVDGIARPIAERLAQKWGQPVVVDNKPGAGTIIGAEFVARAAPDGHTLLLTTDSTITSNPHIYPKLPYDPVKDLAPVTQLIVLPQMVVAHPSLAAGSLKELVALAKASPGISYGSYGSGSQPHLLFEGLKRETGIELLHVPYKGIAPAVTAALAGEVQLTMAGASVSRGHIQAGKLKPLAIARSERLALMPDVPTLREAGFPDIDPQSWFGLFATGGTPPEIVAQIQREVAALFAEPEFREKHMLGRGFDPVLSSPADFAKFIQADMAQKARLVRISGAKAE